MAGNKPSMDQSRKSVVVPFASGVQDPRLGTLVDGVVYEQTDVFLGKTDYIMPRPAFTFYGGPYTNSGGGADPANIYSAIAVPRGNSSPYVTIAGDNNLFVGTDPLLGAPILTGADATDWTTFTAQVPSVYRYPNLGLFENTATGVLSMIIFNQDNDKIINITGVATYTTSALGFSPGSSFVVMDGYVFVSEQDSDAIYNCDLNTPGTWQPSINYIRASQYPGNIIALTRQNNYIVAMKTGSVEYFYNAGLNDTSPLQRTTSYTKTVGCVNADSVASYKDQIFFIGRSQDTAQNAVMMLDKDTTLKVISPPDVSTFVKQVINTTNVRAGCFKAFNKSYYYILLSDSGNFYVYDIELDLWYNWNYGYPPIVVLVGQLSSQGSPLVYQNAGGVQLSTFTQESKDYSSTDNYSYISTKVKMPNISFGTGNRKNLNEISIDAILPTRYKVTVDFEKTVGYNRRTITKTATNMNNLNLKNWGNFVTANITCTFLDSDVDGETFGVSTELVRINSLNLEITNGTS